MYDMMIAPKSTVTARDVLKKQLDKLSLDNVEPNMYDAILKADELWERFGTYVKPDYLLDVWTEWRADNGNRSTTSGDPEV